MRKPMAKPFETPKNRLRPRAIFRIIGAKAEKNVQNATVIISVLVKRRRKMKKRILATMMVFSLALTMMFAVADTNKPAKASADDDWPLSISCSPDFPIIGPNVGETREEQISNLMYEKGKRVVSLTVKNYSPKIVKITKIKKKGAFPYFKVKGLKKGYAHLKVKVKLNRKQAGKKTYTWNIKKYPVGHNDDE